MTVSTESTGGHRRHPTADPDAAAIDPGFGDEGGDAPCWAHEFADPEVCDDHARPAAAPPDRH